MCVKQTSRTAYIRFAVRESHPQLETPPTTRSPSSGFMMCCCRRQASVREHRPAAQEPTTSQGPCVSGNAIEMKPIVGKNDERILDDDRKRQEISPEVTPHQPDNPNKHDSVVSTTKDAESQVVENCVGDNPTTWLRRHLPVFWFFNKRGLMSRLTPEQHRANFKFQPVRVIALNAWRSMLALCCCRFILYSSAPNTQPRQPSVFNGCIWSTNACLSSSLEHLN